MRCMPSPKLEPLVLSAREWQILQGWARRRTTAQALALRSRQAATPAVSPPVSPSPGPWLGPDPAERGHPR